jgi:hypothetical protein
MADRPGTFDKVGVAKQMKTQTGAQFEISIDGTPRTHRDVKAMAIEAAENLKSRHPNSVVVVRDLVTGETTPVAYKPG